jgi:hypothetical protein
MARVHGKGLHSVSEYSNGDISADSFVMAVDQGLTLPARRFAAGRK